MSNMNTLQTPKPFNNYRQDRHTRGWDIDRDIDGYDKETVEKETKRRDREMARTAIQEGLELLENATPEELQFNASKLLDMQESHDVIEEFDQIDEGDYDSDIRTIDDEDPFATENEIGLKSREQIKGALARQATLDSYEDDDFGDSDYNSPMRITNRPR